MSQQEESHGSDLLEVFNAAWNSHDVDRLMSMMTEDCQFFSSSGTSETGQNCLGAAAVREGYAAVFERFKDAAWSDARHVVIGDRGFSEWLFTGTTPEGQKVEVRGCDLFTFRGNKILIKDSYRKYRA
jgi:ketosteroid isomerase-like protein